MFSNIPQLDLSTWNGVIYRKRGRAPSIYIENVEKDLSIEQTLVLSRIERNDFYRDPASSFILQTPYTCDHTTIKGRVRFYRALNTMEIETRTSEELGPELVILYKIKYACLVDVSKDLMEKLEERIVTKYAVAVKKSGNWSSKDLNLAQYTSSLNQMSR